MKYRDEFHHREQAQALARRIRQCIGERCIKVMEVCGTHTVSIHRFGILSLLPENITLLSGPGCPVCVTPNEYVDRAIEYARRRDCILATFGDMNRVPGSYSSLAGEKAKGAHVHYLYSPRDALSLAEKNPHSKIVFFAIGFETTAPAIAAALLESENRGIGNFYLLTALKTVPETLRALALSPGLPLDGFLLPGHLSAITGTAMYQFLPAAHGLACAVAGFEPLDILQAILSLAEQIQRGKPVVANDYKRIVRAEGNRKAQDIMNRVFEPEESCWRGLGILPASGLRLKKDFQSRDAALQIPVTIREPRDHEGCLCGEILKGALRPPQCPLFAKACTPEDPVGPCMVSTEGTCAAYYKYAGTAPEGRLP